MATVSGNTRVVYAAVQGSKGSAAATPTHKFVLSGDASLDPGRAIIQLPETDSSAQQPDNRVVGSSPAGGWSGWMRSSEFAFLSYAALGATVASGSNPNYTHTATLTQALPYLTLWDVIPGQMCTKYVDARIGQLAAQGEALAGIGYSVQAMALSAVLNEAEPSTPTNPASDASLAYPAVVVTVGGSSPGTHDAWSITINRNLTVVRGDLGLASFDVVPGLIGIEGTFRRIFENDDAYNEFHGGSAAATSLTATIFEQALDLLIAENANRSVRYTSSAIQYTETAVPVNVDGTPIIMTRSFRTKRQATIANNLTVVTKNGLATATTSPT